MQDLKVNVVEIGESAFKGLNEHKWVVEVVVLINRPIEGVQIEPHCASGEALSGLFLPKVHGDLADEELRDADTGDYLPDQC
jgi:hypothetical protein